jgi:hypothetical protein
MDNWIAIEAPHSSDRPGSSRYRLSAGDIGGDPSKEHLSVVVVGNSSIDRHDDLLVFEKGLDTLITILQHERRLVQQKIEDRRLAALEEQ